MYLVCGTASLVRRADVEIHGNTSDAVKLAEFAAFGYWERHGVTGLGLSTTATIVAAAGVMHVKYSPRLLKGYVSLRPDSVGMLGYWSMSTARALAMKPISNVTSWVSASENVDMHQSKSDDVINILNTAVQLGRRRLALSCVPSCVLRLLRPTLSFRNSVTAVGIDLVNCGLRETSISSILANGIP